MGSTYSETPFRQHQVPVSWLPLSLRTKTFLNPEKSPARHTRTSHDGGCGRGWLDSGVFSCWMVERVEPSLELRRIGRLSRPLPLPQLLTGPQIFPRGFCRYFTPADFQYRLFPTPTPPAFTWTLEFDPPRRTEHITRRLLDMPNSLHSSSLSDSLSEICVHWRSEEDRRW